jgi:hypothetical protein
MINKWVLLLPWCGHVLLQLHESAVFVEHHLHVPLSIR